MNSKARFIPLIVLGAIVLSLIAVIPAFSAAGSVRFYDADDASEDQMYARAGGTVQVEVDDPDLNVPVKYVILPAELTDVIGNSGVDTGNVSTSVTAEAGSDEVMIVVRDSSVDETEDEEADDFAEFDAVNAALDALTTADTPSASTYFAAGDIIAVGPTTIREVTGVATSTVATTTMAATGAMLPVGEEHAISTLTLTLNAPLDAHPDGSYPSDVVVRETTDRAHEMINVDDCPTCALAPTVSADSIRVDIDYAPMVDSGLGNEDVNFQEVRFSGDTDGKVSRYDVIRLDSAGAATSTEVLSVDNNEERVTLDADGNDDDILVYWGSAVDHSKDVNVRSSADTGGVDVVLTETGKDTGIFRGVVMLSASEDTTEGSPSTQEGDTTPPTLRVAPSGTVTLSYDDDGDRISKTIDVETTAPVLSNFSPAHNDASEDERPEVMADVTDSDSGIEDTKIFVLFALLNDDNEVLTEPLGDAEVVAMSVSAEDDGRVRNITSGFRIEQRMPDELETGRDESTIAWWVVAQDEAGNKAVSDQDTSSDNACDAEMFPATASTDVDVSALQGLGDVTDEDVAHMCQPFIVRVDDSDPTLETAHTGAFWDTDSDEDDKTNTTTSEAKATSIMLTFSEDLDGSTVSADDFEVDGSAPLAANHYSDAGDKVFLDVPALDPDDRPDVALVGIVADLAGNTAPVKELTSDDNNSNDGIGPTLEVTLSGTNTGARPVTESEITITVTTNENTSNPTVMITRIDATDGDGNGVLSEASADSTMVTPRVKSPRTYETTWSTGTAGLYNVYVTAPDGSGNEGALGKKGEDDPVDLSSDTAALLFEVDNAGPEFTLDPASSDDPNAFIRVNFSDEGNEYPAPVMAAGGGYVDADNENATTTRSDAKMSDVDSYGMVTIVSATLAGSDITLERLSDNSFLLVAPNLEIGEHELEIEAEDTAGNSATSAMNLEITEREPFVLSIRAGVSLISFPGDPLDPDINSVFPADHPVQEVITYDPTQPGQWFAAKRDAVTGLLDGNLPNISGGNAYLVRSNSTKDVNVIIDRPSSHDLLTPPQIDLVGGWNLVPVTDITFKLNAGDTITYADYFGDNSAIGRVYGVDTVENRLILVRGPQGAGADRTEGDNLEVGKGYWVFASEATSVAPGVISE